MTEKPTYEELEQRIRELEQAEFEHSRMEQDLLESKQQLASLLQSIQTAVVVHGSDTHIVACNRRSQELLGLTEAQMFGREAIDPAWRFFNEDGTDMPRESYPVNQVLATKSELKNLVAGVYRPSANDVIDVLVNAVPEADDEGNILRVIVTFMDITERKEAEEELRDERDRLIEATAEIETLRGILPLCSFCKKIRDDKGYWEQVDVYIHKHSQAGISPNVCPDCMREQHSDFISDD